MGIDVRTFARRAGGARIGPGESALEVLEAIEEQAFAWAAKVGLDRLFYGSFASSTSLEIEVLPAGQGINFTATKSRISAKCRTSNFGPGYHAAVIDLFDWLAQSLGLVWHWGDGSQQNLDETGFAVERDFDALQQKHLNFLVGVLEFLAEENAQNGAICLIDGLGQDQEGFATPLGIMPNSWPRDIVSASDAQRWEYGSKFFPWWGRDLDAAVVENMLRYLLWQHVEWRGPLSRRESRVLRTVDNVVAKLNSLSHAVPDDVQAALEDLEAAVSEDVVPVAAGIGYRRRRVRRSIADDWTIMLPGVHAESFSEDGQAVIFEGRDTALRAVAVSVTPRSGQPFSWPTSLGETCSHTDANGLSWRVAPCEVDNGEISQFAVVAFSDSDGSEMLMLTFSASDVALLAEFDVWLNSIRFHGTRPGPMTWVWS